MLNIGIAGLGWWGKTLVESMQGSEHGRIVAGADPMATPELKDFAALHKFKLVADVEDLLADPNVHGVILATPHSMGSIAAGKSADFIVLAANPLDNISNSRKIDRVYLRGTEVPRAEFAKRWRANSTN